MGFYSRPVLGQYLGQVDEGGEDVEATDASQGATYSRTEGPPPSEPLPEPPASDVPDMLDPDAWYSMDAAHQRAYLSIDPLVRRYNRGDWPVDGGFGEALVNWIVGGKVGSPPQSTRPETWAPYLPEIVDVGPARDKAEALYTDTLTRVENAENVYEAYKVGHVGWASVRAAKDGAFFVLGQAEDARDDAQRLAGMSDADARAWMPLEELRARLDRITETPVHEILPEPDVGEPTLEPEPPAIAPEREPTAITDVPEEPEQAEASGEVTTSVEEVAEAVASTTPVVEVEPGIYRDPITRVVYTEPPAGREVLTIVQGGGGGASAPSEAAPAVVAPSTLEAAIPWVVGLGIVGALFAARMRE